MDLGWKILIPASLGWFMLMAVFQLGRDEGWNGIVVGVVAGVLLLGCVVLITSAIGISRANREREGAMF
jgi:NADH-quinone oxidoreductase subunit H